MRQDRALEIVNPLAGAFLAARTHRLNPNARSVPGAVGIPASELPGRTHELPAKGVTLAIVPGEDAEAALTWLVDGGRTAQLAPLDSPASGGALHLWEPNGFLAEVLPLLPPGRALDLACGTGRDAVALAASGWRVTAIDHLPDAIERGRDLAARYVPPGTGSVEWVVADVKRGLPPNRFDLITMFFFLDREVLKRAIDALAPGGSLIVETFTEANRARHGKPRSPGLALGEGEVLRLAPGLAVVRHSEAWRADGRHTARVWLRKG